MGKSIVVKIIQFFLEHFLMYSLRLRSPAWEYGGLTLSPSLGLGTEKREERSEGEEKLKIR